jgi:hypothetical protein
MRVSSRSEVALRSAFALCAFVCIVADVVASPETVERFDASTWARMQKQLPRPAAVVFTATWCANCPAIIERLAQALRKRRLAPQVIAVVIDEANSEKLLSSPHYASALRLFAFDGDETRLRYGVDARWRGVTPYTALLGREDKVIFVAGTPSDEEIEAWLAPAN